MKQYVYIFSKSNLFIKKLLFIKIIIIIYDYL